MIITDANNANNNTSPKTVKTSLCARNSATTPAAVENKTFVIQLLDGKEYPVTIYDTIKKGYDC